jgi:RHS repeat-associated protein
VTGATTETYNYASTSNRLNSISVGGSTVRSFSYANSGQVSQDVRGGSTTYDFTTNKDGRLSSAALNSSTVGAYLYNGLEQRVAKTVSGTTTYYVLDDDGHVLSEDDASGNPIREYIWMGDMPVALIDRTGISPTMYFIHADHLNRPQKLTDGSAALVWDAVFQPFGEAYSVSGSATNLLMFPGQFYDSETALAQNWHRDYDATLGRYIQSDPIGLAGGINTYAYANASPYGVTDPTGEFGVVGGGINVGAGYLIALATGQCYNWDNALQDFALGFADVGLLAKLNKLRQLAGFGKVGKYVEQFLKDESGALKLPGTTKGAMPPKPLLGQNPRAEGTRTNTDLPGDRATAKSIFRNQTRGQDVTQTAMPNGGIRRTAADGTQIRMNSNGATRLDLPSRGPRSNGETIHIPPQQ